jgi:hypothetical protein
MIDKTILNVYNFDNGRLKEAWISLFNKMAFTHAITFSWNRSVGLDRARSDLKALHRIVDRAMLGSRFNRYPTNKRTLAIFTFEGLENEHVHVHSLWKCPPNKILKFCKLFPQKTSGVWTKVVPTGSYDVELLTISGLNNESIGYMLKGQNMNSDAREIVWSEDFARFN